MRPTRPQMFMEIAHVVAKRSTCMRLNVGAVIVQDRRIVSIGYNGAPAGAPHCAGNDCPGKHYCQETIHAEDNAMRHLPAGLRLVNNRVVDLDVYVTDSPCASCFDKIKDHGEVSVASSSPIPIASTTTWSARGLAFTESRRQVILSTGIRRS
jgi:dCMP deaminase